MKVKDLKKIIENCDDDLEVLICDDGMSPEYYSIDFSTKADYSRLVRKASTKKEKVMYTPPGLDEEKSRTDCIPSYCQKCKNMMEGSLKKDGWTTTIDCNSRDHGQVIKNVLIYDGTECCCYDPKIPVYIEKDVQYRAPVYKDEKILMLVTDLYNNKLRK